MSDDSTEYVLADESLPILPKKEENRTTLKGLAQDRNGRPLTQEEIVALSEKLRGRGEDFHKLPRKDKQDFVLRELGDYMLDRVGSLEDIKEAYRKTITDIEIENDKDIKGIHAKHLNMKSERVTLKVTSDNGRVITFNNKEALEAYRLSIQKKNERTKDNSDLTTQDIGKIAHSTREFE
jgi:penicillin V acylase-like amidase (Ntn superfamily)